MGLISPIRRDALLCNDFITRNRGNIRVSSEVGKGSVFSLINHHHPNQSAFRFLRYGIRKT